MGRKEEEEQEEWRRFKEERRQLSMQERLHGAKWVLTQSGFVDGRSRRRTYRIKQLQLRVHPRVYAIVDALVVRDGHGSRTALLEVMLEVYFKEYGELSSDLIPSDEELLAMIEEEQDKKHAE